MSGRSLTIAETSLARTIFKRSINYTTVKIHHEKYAFFQPSQSGMTPNGEIYIDGNVVADYGLTPQPASKAFFIHEMVHVWQKQNGILNPVMSAIGNSIRHGFNYNKAYKYTLKQTSDLLEYRMEQQAQIIEDYVRSNTFGLNPAPGYIQNSNITRTQRDQLYNAVLANFISNPSYAKRN